MPFVLSETPAPTIEAQRLAVGDYLANPRRIVTDVLIADGRVIVTSRIPIDSATRLWVQKWLPTTPILVGAP